MTVFCSGLTPFSLLNCCPALLSYHHSFDPISFLFLILFPFLSALLSRTPASASLDWTAQSRHLTPD